MLTRRDLLKTLGLLAAAAPLTPRRVPATEGGAILKKIPAAEEKLPVIGMGTSRTFDVELDDNTRARLSEVLRIFFARGGKLIDSSPMYGTAESVVGELLAGLDSDGELFAATKVWTWGRGEGVAQMQASARRLGVPRLDLIQIHNLRDWRVHVETLKDWKADGKVRYIGVTTSHGRDHDEMETALKAEQFDFVQFSYNVLDRAAEKRLLPLAADRGTAVIVNRPFQRGRLFQRVKNHEVPAWAHEFGCASWGQFFLKFAASHPAVTCVIPATSKPHHMEDNMGAAFGRLPTTPERHWMQELVAGM